MYNYNPHQINNTAISATEQPKSTLAKTRTLLNAHNTHFFYTYVIPEKLRGNRKTKTNKFAIPGLVSPVG